MNLTRIIMVILAIFTIAISAQAQRIEVSGDTLAVYFDKGRSTLSVDSLIMQYPIVVEMVDIACIDLSKVIVIEASADAVRWIADALHDALNAAIAEGRGIKGRMLTEVAGFDDPLRVFVITREHQQRGEKCRCIKMYVRTAPWASREEFEKLKDMLKEMKLEINEINLLLASLRAQEEDTTVDVQEFQFGGVTVGLSTAPDAKVMFTFGVRVHLNERWTLDGQIGNSIFHNHQTVEDGKRVSAYDMFYHGSVTYTLKSFTSDYQFIPPETGEYGYGTDTTSQFGLVISFSQLENDTQESFDYLVKRRVVEVGVAYERDWFAVRGLIGYGFDEFWWTDAVDYGWFPRVQLFTIFD